MRSLVLLLAVLALGGCMNVSDLAKGTRYHMSDAGLLDHSDSRRVNNMRIQPDSFIYIAQGAFAPPGECLSAAERGRRRSLQRLCRILPDGPPCPRP